MYQQHRRGPSSLKFAKLKGEEINEGPFNQLEYTLLCAITLIMEQTNQQLSSINAFKLFNDIVSKVNFNLPIYLKSQDEITKEPNKIARIRKFHFCYYIFSTFFLNKIAQMRKFFSLS